MGEKKFFLSLFITTFLCSVLFIGLNGAFAGTTTRVNVASDGAEANGGSYDPSISSGGRYVAFQSYASKLVDDDTNGEVDVFERSDVSSVVPVPDIKANGSDGPIRIITEDTVSVTVALQAGNLSSNNCDWWCAAQTQWGWYCYDYDTNKWIEGLQVTYMGPCADIPTAEVLNMNLPAGDFVFYFGVDDNMDGTVDGNLYYDSVNVTVNDGPAPPTSGEWSGIADFGEIDFVINAEGNGIEEVAITFKEYKCGAVTSNGTITIFKNPPYPINNGYVAFDLNLDPPPVDKTLTIEGTFNSTGTSISGTYEADFYGTICNGTFSATPDTSSAQVKEKEGKERGKESVTS